MLHLNINGSDWVEVVMATWNNSTDSSGNLEYQPSLSSDSEYPPGNLSPPETLLSGESDSCIASDDTTRHRSLCQLVFPPTTD